MIMTLTTITTVIPVVVVVVARVSVVAEPVGFRAEVGADTVAVVVVMDMDLLVPSRPAFVPGQLAGATASEADQGDHTVPLDETRPATNHTPSRSNLLRQHLKSPRKANSVDLTKQRNKQQDDHQNKQDRFTMKEKKPNKLADHSFLPE